MQSSLVQFHPVVKFQNVTRSITSLTILTLNQYSKKSPKTVNQYFGCCHCKETLLFTLMKDLDKTALSSEILPNICSSISTYTSSPSYPARYHSLPHKGQNKNKQKNIRYICENYNPIIHYWFDMETTVDAIKTYT